eukprot:s822_g11.t7
MIRPLPEVTREAVARLDIRLRLVIEVMLAPRSPIAWPSVTRGHVRLPAATATQPLAGGDRLGDNEYSRHGHLRARSVRHARDATSCPSSRFKSHVALPGLDVTRLLDEAQVQDATGSVVFSPAEQNQAFGGREVAAAPALTYAWRTVACTYPGRTGRGFDPRGRNGSSVALWEHCPAHCPVHMHVHGKVCQFTCVDGSSGSCTNPAMVVVDNSTKRCRSCGIPGCRVCSPEDYCFRCATGFYLTEERDVCISKFGFLIPCVCGLLGGAFVVLASWYIWLRSQPVINSRVLKRAIMRRHHLNLRDHTSERHDWYPLMTNLCRPREDGHVVGGRALLMFFNFQAFILLWCACSISAWVVCATVYGSRMFVEGNETGKADVYSIYPKSCWLQKASWHSQFSCTSSLQCLRCPTQFVSDVVGWSLTREATMKDFSLILTGFPAEEGNEVEKNRANFVRRATGCQPVGVSVCWTYNHSEVQELIARETWLWGKGRDSCGPMKSTSTMMDEGNSSGHSSFRCIFEKLNQLLAPPLQLEDAELGKARRHEERAAAVARDAVSTSFMYAIFATELDRDHAKKVFSSDSEVPLYMGRHPIRQDPAGGGSEPESVLWKNFQCDIKVVPYKVMASIAGIAVSILFWGVFFYFPFAVYEAWSYSALGHSTDFASETTFSLLVVVGNQLLYLLCDKASKHIGFRFASQELAAYTGLYTMALLSNMFIDMWILWYTTTTATENLGLEVTWRSFLLNQEERVSFPLRDAKLGERLYAYNFPSCFLLPFLCEALFTVILPYHVYSKLVGSQPISQRGADACLLPITFDMARYADVVLNMTQATVSLFFSPGYVWPTFIFLFLSHLFVYAWDHYRVLRHVRQFRFSSYRTEKVAQRLLALPGASLATCVMFQLYQVQAVRPTTTFAAVVTLSAPALLHIAFYMLVLEYAVPWLGRTAHVPAMQRYSEVAKIFPGNFFNMNPVHCLRSRYLHNHQPPCIFYQIGKEHLLEPNPKLGLFYSAPEWNNEKTSTFVELAQFARKSLAEALAMAHPRFAAELQESQEIMPPKKLVLKIDRSIHLKILHEDGQVLAVAKPFGVLAHPSPGFWERGTIAHAVVDRMPAEMLEERGNHNEWDSFIPRCIVHRLDAGTTGVMIMAKSITSESHLAQQFRAADFMYHAPLGKKVYVSLLLGHPGGALQRSDITVMQSIGRHPKNGRLWAVVPDGKQAKTVIRVHAFSKKHSLSLVTAELFTGRTHQIRVHCSHLEAPVANDSLYAPASKNKAFQQSLELALPKGRQLLHAWALDLDHPTRERGTLRLRAPLPEDMAAVVKKVWPSLALEPASWPGMPARLQSDAAPTGCASPEIVQSEPQLTPLQMRWLEWWESSDEGQRWTSERDLWEEQRQKRPKSHSRWLQSSALTEGRDDQRLDSPPRRSPQASGSGARASEAPPKTAAKGLGAARKTRKSMVTFAEAQVDDEQE